MAFTAINLARQQGFCPIVLKIANSYKNFFHTKNLSEIMTAESRQPPLELSTPLKRKQNEEIPSLLVGLKLPEPSL